MNIEQGLRIENENLKRLLEQTERERDEALANQVICASGCKDRKALHEALAQNERFKSVVEAVANIGVDFGYGAYEIQTDTIDFARVILSEQPPAALAALKAGWQAIGAANAVIAIEQDKSLKYMNAQIQPFTYPDCRCQLDLPHKDSPCAIGRKKGGR